MQENEVKEVQGVLVSEQDLGLYAGYIPCMIDKLEEDPVLEWKGSPIDVKLWNQIVSFMRWTYETYKSEAQLRLYYNETLDIWDVAVMPQHVETGLSSKELPHHVDRDKVLGLFDSDAGWREAGTVHHHCSSGAFQSSIDLDDEKDKNGLHITLGDMECLPFKPLFVEGENARALVWLWFY